MSDVTLEYPGLSVSRRMLEARGAVDGRRNSIFLTIVSNTVAVVITISYLEGIWLIFASLGIQQHQMQCSACINRVFHFARCRTYGHAD